MVPRPARSRLDETDWSERTARHEERVRVLLAAHPLQAPGGAPHPVWQFLFRYYSHRPAQVRRWHPGFGVALLGRPPHREYPHYVGTTDDAGVTVDAAHLDDRRPTVEFVHRLLTSTSARPAQLNCFGLHEWAMVYRSPDDRRHLAPLRLGERGTDAVVEANTLRCTHFDAFRFFTDAAAPRNSDVLTRERQVETEQPGCVHAGMDLYKWAYKLSPLIESDLVVDALQCAFDLRELDMAASPYDFGDLGLEPVPIETAPGRAEYVRRQARLAERTQVLRARLAERCAALIDATPPRAGARESGRHQSG